MAGKSLLTAPIHVAYDAHVHFFCNLPVVLNTKQLTIYRAVNAAVHFIWWLIMIWVVVLMMGLATFAILTWVGYNAVEAVLANQKVLAPTYVNWQNGHTSWNISSGEAAAAGGDLVLATMIKNGWPPAATCPSTCLNLNLFAFVEVRSVEWRSTHFRSLPRRTVSQSLYGGVFLIEHLDQ